MKTTSKLLSLFVILAALQITPLRAQDEPLLLLTDSVDPVTGSVSLLWVDIAEGTQRPVTSFQSSGHCPPQVFGDGTTLLYEPFVPGQTPYVYQIDLNSGSILPVDSAEQLGLQCPVVNPDEKSIAWLQPSDAFDQIVITDVDGGNPVVLATHQSIYDTTWSPDGKVLIHTSIDQDSTFRPLYSHAESQNGFWPRDAGLVIDYAWIPDGSALLVAYYTQDNAVLGRMERECVITTGCHPIPLANFDLEAGLLITNAFSPDNTRVVIIEETTSARGELNSDLYSVDLMTGETVRLTNTPALIKTSAIWADNIYFTGVAFDASTFTFADSAIYQVSPQGGDAQITYQAEDYFPVQIIWSSN